MDKRTLKLIITIIGLFTIVKLFLFLKVGSFQFGLSSYVDLHSLADWKQTILSTPFVFEDTTILNGKAFLNTGHLNILISHYLGLSSYDAWTLYLFWVCCILYFFLRKAHNSLLSSFICTLTFLISVPFLDFIYGEFSPSDLAILLSTALFITGLYFQNSNPRLHLILWGLSIWNRIDFSILVFVSFAYGLSQTSKIPLKKLSFIALIIFLSLGFRYFSFEGEAVIGDGNMRIHAFPSNLIETNDNEQSFGSLIPNLRDNFINTWFYTYNPRNEDQEFKFYFYFIIPLLLLIRKRHITPLLFTLGAYSLHALFFPTNPVRYQLPFWVLFLIIISDNQKNSIRTFTLVLISTVLYAFIVRPFWVGPYEYYTSQRDFNLQAKSIHLNNKFSLPTPYQFRCQENLDFFARFINDCKIRKAAQFVYSLPLAQKCHLILPGAQCPELKIQIQKGEFPPESEFPLNKGFNIINLINNGETCSINSVQLLCKDEK